MSGRVDTIHEQVRGRFARIADDPDSETRFEIGRTSLGRRGYDEADVAALPDEAADAFAGVGNPLSLGPLVPGMTVLDLGCGSGVDTLLAADRVGPAGRVIGVDMTPAMLARARRAARALGLSNVDIREGAAESIDLPDASVDVVISNGVLNLCPDKERVLAELFRVLKPGGRLQLADMSLVDGVSAELLARVGEWSD